jgi:hypothetical protein
MRNTVFLPWMHDVSHAPPRGVKADSGPWSFVAKERAVSHRDAAKVLPKKPAILTAHGYTALRKNEANAMDDDLEGWGWSFIT